MEANDAQPFELNSSVNSDRPAEERRLKNFQYEAWPALAGYSHGSSLPSTIAVFCPSGGSAPGRLWRTGEYWSCSQRDEPDEVPCLEEHTSNRLPGGEPKKPR